VEKPVFGVDLHHDREYTQIIEVNVVCEQIPAKEKIHSRKARVCSRAFFIPILKGD
jgi:hypothetical protein